MYDFLFFKFYFQKTQCPPLIKSELASTRLC